MIPTLPVRLRNRLAEAILAALHDAEARRRLRALVTDPARLAAWLGADGPEHQRLARLRAERAHRLLAELPLVPRDAPLGEVLAAAATLFDAGLGFEVHELLEPRWRRAEGGEREAIQGLIQVAVGCQHLANGNLAGARALVEEGAAHLVGRTLAGLDLGRFVPPMV